jgi:hypothetical protein
VVSAEEALSLFPNSQGILGSFKMSVMKGAVRDGLRKSLREKGLPENIINYVLANVNESTLALIYLGTTEFDPGKADEGGNRFVYTCRCGWIDLGHFFSSAGGAAVFQDISKPLANLTGGDAYYSLVASFGAFAGGVGVEFQQMYDKTTKPVDGWSASAWTLEDLPSDWLGAFFGPEVPGTDFGQSFERIKTQMASLFQRCGAVNPHTQIGNKTAGDYLNADAAAYGEAAFQKGFNSYKGVDPYNYTPFPKQTRSHCKVCDKDNNPIR